MKQYSREFLLSFSEKDWCKRRPEVLDPMLWRDSPSPDIVEGGLTTAKFSARRERDVPQELPEWRRTGNGGAILPQQSNRRKSLEEEGHVPYAARPATFQHDRGSRWERGGRSVYHNSDVAESGRAKEQHDGLLGSGTGLGSAITGTRGNGGGRSARASDPRFAKTFSEEGNRYREEDTFNAETFGESESNDGRAEQERRRRESFELERKEQQRLKEHKKQLEKQDSKSSAAITDSLPPDHQLPDANGPAVPIGRVPAPPATRPLVPPGFSHAKALPRKDNKEAEANGVEEPVDKSVVLERSNSSVAAKPDPARSSGISETIKCSGELSSRLGSPFHGSQFRNGEDGSMLKHVRLGEDGEPTEHPLTPSSTVYPGRMLPMPVGPSLEDIEKSLVTEFPSVGSGDSLGPATQTFYTCEDIEQTLLGNAGSKTKRSSSCEEPGDSDVSHRLLSLLQKGSGKQWEDDLSEQTVVPPPEEPASEAKQEPPVPTLEGLFGRAFMTELRSTDAPLSAKVAAVAETKYVDNLSLVQNKSQEDFSKSTGAKVLDGQYPNQGWTWSQSRKGDIEGTEQVRLDRHPSGEPSLFEVDYADKLEIDRLTRRMLPHVEALAEAVKHQKSEDHFKYIRAKEQRSKVNDSIPAELLEDPSIVGHGPLKSPSGPIDELLADINSGAAPPLFRSQSPSAHFQQLQQALAMQGSKSAASNKQFPVVGSFPMANGDFGVPVHGRTQQQGMYGGRQFPPLPSQAFQPSPLPYGFEPDHLKHGYVPNGPRHHQQQHYHQNQQQQHLNSLHLQQQQHPKQLVPPMGYGGGLRGQHLPFPQPMAYPGEEAGWFGRDPGALVHHHHQQQQQQQQQRLFGMNKVTFS